MKILMVSQFFDPEPTIKGLVFAKALQEKGHQVSVITGFPNYPGGKVYPGYRIQVYQEEDYNGILVRRVPLYPSHDRSKVGRILNYLSFCFSVFVAVLIYARKSDVIYVYHPPMTVGFAVALAAFFVQRPFVYDIQDLWPDTLKATGMIGNRYALALIESICAWIYKRADQLVVLAPGFKKRLEERGVPSKKIRLIYNWCDENALQISDQFMNDKMKNRFNILFAGNMGKAQALGAVIEAAAIVQKKNPKVLFNFLGAGLEVEQLKAQSRNLELENVQFLGHVPMTKVGAILHQAQVLLVHLKDDPLFRITVPSKTQAYLSVGRPILMAVSGDAADLILNSGGGVCVQPEKPKAIAEAILDLADLSHAELDKMGNNGKEYYRSVLSLSKGVEKFVALFEEMRADAPKELS